MGSLDAFHSPVRMWFETAFAGTTTAQEKGWEAIQAGESTLILSPTGSGKTLAAFLVAIDRLMFSAAPPKRARCRALYVSPLKALAADIEKNLRAPLAGIAATSEREGVPHRSLVASVRTGDTSTAERARLGRAPPDILITTPESFYLLLTQNARDILAAVDTVIIDEIHSLVATKRGAHLALSLERLEALRPPGAPALQRIGLSATQRPLAEVARLLGGSREVPGERGSFEARPVRIVDAGTKKAWELKVEVPVTDMARLAEARPEPEAKDAPGSAPLPPSIWPSIHERLVELVRAHRSTMIFVNSRRLAERLASAINDLAGEEIALAHHGSIAQETRMEIEDRLKRGDLPAIVATSSLELGLDLGAVDLVVQIEAPPSIASGLQRIGRAGHAVGAVSRGVLFPKHRGDLLPSAAATFSMMRGDVEETFYPRNPLDILAQQIVAIAALDEIDVEELFALVRRAAPFSELARTSFEGVLDMLSGRYPSDEFADLRPRITYDRRLGRIKGRDGARRIAVANAGTIPDRGLFGVYLSGADERKSRRVGELDEEMVFESRAGDVFLLGASSWRIDEITFDRVLVSPAPGTPGKMPFWRGDRPGRPLAFGRAIGALGRELVAEPAPAALARLSSQHGLDTRAAENLLAYLAGQVAATKELPSDRTVVIERTHDDLGALRVCVLSPFGARVHAPWCQAVAARFSRDDSLDVEGIWSDDGMIFRLPEAETSTDAAAFVPSSPSVEDLLVETLGGSALFAARFRENAARALLLPRRRPGQRTPLWSLRKRASDLLRVASRYTSFPIVLETMRECIRDVFDLPGLVGVLRGIEGGSIRVVTVDSQRPSPFAASLLFSYVANFIYDGDAPLAERRAQALAIDPSELRELLGEAELRGLLDAGSVAEIEANLQRTAEGRAARGADGLHDLLLAIGDLGPAELRARAAVPEDVPSFLEALVGEGRVLAFEVAGEPRFGAVEDAARFRDALGVLPKAGTPPSLLVPVADPLGDLVSRYARTHGPFTADAAAERFGLDVRPVRDALERLVRAGRVIEGEFLPTGTSTEFCDAGVLRMIKQRSLAKLRKEVEAVDGPAMARFLAEWQGLFRPRSGSSALLSVLEQLAGAPIPMSALEADVLPARLARYRASELDMLSASGEIVWVGLERVGANDGRIGIYLAEQVPLLAPSTSEPAKGDLAERLRGVFRARGAVFYADLVAETGAFGPDVLAALWELVWAGEVTNDTFAALRSYLRGADTDRRERPRALDLRRARRPAPPGSEGRWSLLARSPRRTASDTERRTALARSLLDRHGVLTREAVHAEGVEAGFSAVYDVLKVMEETGRVRRGYFVEGLGATQFALPAALDHLRRARKEPADGGDAIVLAATDPANPYGAALTWPEREGTKARPQRAAGAHVVLFRGRLVAFLGRSDKSLLTFPSADDGERAREELAVARALGALVDTGRLRTLLLEEVDGSDPTKAPLAKALLTAGFTPSSQGFFRRPATRASGS